MRSAGRYAERRLANVTGTGHATARSGLLPANPPAPPDANAANTTSRNISPPLDRLICVSEVAVVASRLARHHPSPVSQSRTAITVCHGAQKIESESALLTRVNDWITARPHLTGPVCRSRKRILLFHAAILPVCLCNGGEQVLSVALLHYTLAFATSEAPTNML